MKRSSGFLRLTAILCYAFISNSGTAFAQVQLEAEPAPASESPAELTLDLGGFVDLVTGVSFSADGHLLAAVGGKETRIWDCRTGELRATLRGERKRNSYGNVYAVAFSPDGKELLVGIDDFGDPGSIRVYDTKNLDEIKEVVAGHQAPCKQLAFSANGKYLASAGENGKIILWDWKSRRELATVEPTSKEEAYYSFFEFPTSDPYLVVGEPSGPSVIGVPSGKRMPREAKLPAKLRDWLAGARRYDYPNGHQPSAVRLDLGHDRWIAGGGGKVGVTSEYWAASFKGSNRAPRAVYDGHRYTITAAALAPGQDWAATGDLFGEVHLWNTATGKAKQVFAARGKPIYNVAFDRSGNEIAFGITPFKGSQWGRNNYGPVQSKFVFDKRVMAATPTTDVQTALLERNGRTLDVENKDGLFFVNSLRGSTRESRFPVRAGAVPTCLTFLRESSLGLDDPVILGDDSGGLICFNPQNELVRRAYVAHRSFVTAACESADHRFLVSASTDRTLRVWSLENYKPTGEVDFRYLSDNVVEVKPFTAAKKAGIRVGDRFLGLDSHSLTDLENMLLVGDYPYKPGQTAEAKMERNGRAYSIPLKLREGMDVVEPVLSVYVDGESWIAWTPEGYYDASPGADKLLGWHVNQGPTKSARYYQAHQFRKQLYRPDIVDQIFTAPIAADAIQIANESHVEKKKHVDFRDPSVIAKHEPPVVQSLQVGGAPSTEGKIEVRAAVQSQNDLPVEGITLLVNGRPAVLKPRIQDAAAGGGKEVVEEVSLLPGRNEIAVIASNQASSSQPKIRTIEFKPKQSDKFKPDLYVLAVGIAEYEKSELNLQFPGRDATEFAKAMRKQAKGLYENVEVKLLTNKEAKLENILQGMDWLVKNATQQDVAIFFVSAHGFRDARQNFYLATHTVNPDSLRGTGLSFEEINKLLEELPCKTLLFADTCHSGGIRGAKGAADDPLRDLMTAEVGAIVFSSCTPREISMEHADWQHGAFTKALLDTLADPKSDYDKPADGFLTVTELDLNISRRVKALTKGQQHPVTEKPATIRDFNLAKIH